MTSLAAASAILQRNTLTFDKILHSKQHLLHYLLPPSSASSQPYNLRIRPHSQLLPQCSGHLMDSNCIIRMLHKNIYWWCHLHLLKDKLIILLYIFNPTPLYPVCILSSWLTNEYMIWPTWSTMPVSVRLMKTLLSRLWNLLSCPSNYIAHTQMFTPKIYWSGTTLDKQQSDCQPSHWHWWCGVVVNDVGLINKVTQHWAQLSLVHVDMDEPLWSTYAS